MRAAALRLLPLALLAACTYNTTVHHLDDAPQVARSDSAAVVSTPPRGAVRLGTIEVRGNRNKIGAPCTAEAVAEAKKMGATHVVVTPVESGAARAVRCTAEAWYLGEVVQPGAGR